MMAWLFAILGIAASSSSSVTARCAHVVVLKLGGSGSTWFADTLSSIPGVRFEHQLLKTATNKHTEAASAEAELVQRATAPCGRSVLVGFDANPLVDEQHYHGQLSYARALHGLPGVAFVTWTRSNAVLKAFSEINFRLAEGACHVHNMNSKTMDVDVIEQCRAGRPLYEANQTTLLSAIRECACTRLELLSMSRSIAPHNATPLEMVYERFVRDENAALAALFRFLHVPEKYRIHVVRTRRRQPSL